MSAPPELLSWPPPLRSLPGCTEVHGVDLALDAMEIGIFEWDACTGVHRLSERCRAILGFTGQTDIALGRLLARVHPDDLPLAADARAALSPDGPGRYAIELRIVLPDGALRWVQAAGQLKPGGGGGAPRGYGVLRDITGQKTAAQQLYERTSQVRAFVQGAPVPMAIFDRAMRFVALSDRFLEQWRPAEDPVGRSFYDVFPVLPHWPAALRRALAGERQHCEGERLVRKDGAVEWIRWELHPWYRADNEAGGLILFAELITPRVQAQQALRDAQARTELAARAGAFGIYERDLTAGSLSWDERMRELFGLPADGTITEATFQACIHPEDRARVAATFQDLIAAGGGDFINMEHRAIHRPDGAIRWISSTGHLQRSAHDGHFRAVGVAQDITARKRAELALKERTAELRRADERKNVYLAMLSHELRNPLAPIRTAAHLLASPKLTGAQLRWVADVIQRQAGQMTSLLDDLLEITRLSRGGLVLRRQRVPLSGIAQSALEAARPLIDARHHTLQVSLPQPSPMVLVDPRRVSQVLSNLLTNAAKYTDPGGRIGLAARIEKDTLILAVRDSGIGIPREALEKIFGMFWQADSGAGRSQGGLGIGLAFARGVVQLHGGTIDAYSDGPGCGSELVVRLPLHPPSATGSPPAGTGEDLQSHALGGGRRAAQPPQAGDRGRPAEEDGPWSSDPGGRL